MKRAEARKAEEALSVAQLQQSVEQEINLAHYSDIAANVGAYCQSTNHRDFCIQLLPKPIDVPSEPAHTLFFTDVGGLDAGTPEDGFATKGVQGMWLRALGEDASLWPKEVGGRPVTLTMPDTHASPFLNGRKPDNSHFAVIPLWSHGPWGCRDR